MKVTETTRCLMVAAIALWIAAPSRAAIDSNSTVFIILMENHVWSDIAGSPSAPYINNVLLPMAAHAEQYYNPPGNHPSLPNYLWLEAGTNFGIADDNPPSVNHQATTNHLVTQLKNAGITWRAYEEDITGTTCPLTDNYPYAVKHDPFAYFDDVTSGNNSNSAFCISNIRPYTQLAGDLNSNTVARYNFITPNMCDDMHDVSGCATTNAVRNGDTWLSNNLPRILGSAAYSNGGAVIIAWDEREGSADGPIGLMVLSPFAKRGYSNSVAYTHSSTLRTLQKIFGVRPFLGDAANATDLSDLFLPGAIPQRDAFAMDGRADATNYLRSATNMYIWAAVQGQTLYVATWSPGNYPGDSNKNDHFIIVSDQLLPAATQPAFPAWTKSGSNAVATNMPYLAGESANSFAGWFNAPAGSRAAKWTNSSGVMEGALDLAAAFGTNIMTGTIYIAAGAYGTTNGGALVSQGPAASGVANGNVESNEFLALSVPALLDITSPYSAMTVAGTFNGWNPSLSNMHLAADSTWWYDGTFTNATGVQFKIAANGAWTPFNWGDNNQAQFAVPLAGSGEAYGSNVAVTSTLNGSYRFTFNDATLAYTLQSLSGDSVGDGVPDWWRAQYFGGDGTSTNGNSCAMCDPDGDRLSNYQEFRAGTDPTNNQSFLAVQSVVVVPSAGSGAQVQWQSVTGKSYYVDRSTNLPAASSFATLQSNITGEAVSTIFTDQAAAGAAAYLYRIGVQ